MVGKPLCHTKGRKTMTGSLQIKNGKYYAVINYKDKYGKQRQKWKSTGLPTKGNKRRATEMLNNLLNDVNYEQLASDEDILFWEYMYQWLDIKAFSVEQNTLESYRDILKRYVEPYFKERKITLKKLTPMHIQEYYGVQIANGLSPTTVLKQHANIRNALQHAYKMDLIPSNPADKVTLPRKRKYVANFLDEQGINTVLEFFKDEPIFPVVVLASFLALRRSEVLGLKWSSVNLEMRTLLIKDTVVEYKTVVDKPRTKNNASHRTLPIPDVIHDFLVKLKQTQDENAAMLGSGYTVNDYVCKWDDGRPFRPDYVSEKFHHRVKKCPGVGHVRFHDLRHSTASALMASGYSLKAIQEYLGHGDLGTTANIYAHLQFQVKADMADTMQSIITLKLC